MNMKEKERNTGPQLSFRFEASAFPADVSVCMPEASNVVPFPSKPLKGPAQVARADADLETQIVERALQRAADLGW
jgi:hypothetical protein